MTKILAAPFFEAPVMQLRGVVIFLKSSDKLAEFQKLKTKGFFFIEKSLTKNMVITTDFMPYFAASAAEQQIKTLWH